jgi:bacterial/archaeal transporter family-2 protein
LAPFVAIGLHLAALLGGAAFVLQQVANANLRGALGSPFWAGLTNFIAGGLALSLVLIAIREPIPSVQVMAKAPWFAWIGGCLGALYICGIILLLPKLGAATVVALFMVGQVLTSLTFDHFGLLGAPVREVGLLRMLGAALMIAGVGLICAF